MSFSSNTRGRSWVGTIHITNMENAGLTKKQYEDPEYLADYFISLWEKSGTGRKAGITICISKEGCYHGHIACYGNVTTLKKVSDVLFQSHIEPQLGGKEQLKAYLLKEGVYSEKGEQVLYSKGLDAIEERQGSRNDLEEIESLLEQGYRPEQIFDESFRYRKYEKMIKSAYLSKRIKETPLIKEMHNEYHFGKSGSGKTYTYYRLCKKHSPEDVYLCNDYANSSTSGGGFDFYSNNPARILVLDEFRGNMTYNTFLSILDVYSRNQQHARYQNIYNLWESVIICSIYSPEDVYGFMVDETKRRTDSMKQMIRRLNKIVYHWRDKEGHYRTYTMDASTYFKTFDITERAEQFEKDVPYNKYSSYKEALEKNKMALEGIIGEIQPTEWGEIVEEDL